LRSYETAYLERDLADLARAVDLVPFRQFQRLAALRSGQLLVYADLARDAGQSPQLARRYMDYLTLSYQALLLPPYGTNLTSTIVKSPKVYWLDLGLLRQLTRYQGPVTGQLLETLVVTEVHKWVRTRELPVELAFYRTRSGLEVDLMITTPSGVLGIEVKAGRRVGPGDHRALRDVGAAIGARWLGGLVVYQGEHVEPLAPGIWSMPVHRLLVG
jgi:predicted AAA+ superfamily ATPase